MRPDKRKIRKTGCPAKGSLFPLKGGFAIADKEITLKLYSPLTGDFHENEIDEVWLEQWSIRLSHAV